jgi:addiction module HigA family antidote
VRREYLDRFGLSEREAAKRLGLSLRTLNELVCGKRDMTWRTAFRLEREGVRSAVDWMVLQAHYDAWHRHLEGGTNGGGARQATAPS